MADSSQSLKCWRKWRTHYNSFLHQALWLSSPPWLNLAGKSYAKKLRKQDLSVEEAVEKFCETLGGWNWGEFSFSLLDVEQGVGKLSVKNSLETRVRSASNNFGCNFLSNFVAGFLSELFGKNVAVKERRCASLEGKICEFEFHAVGNGV